MLDDGGAHMCSSECSYTACSTLSKADRVDKLAQMDTINLYDDPVDEELIQSGRYRSIVGALLYVSNMTRPDISAAISFLSRFLDRPSRRAWNYAKQILKYLITTKDKCLVLGDLDSQTNLITYVDANFAPLGDRKSQSGILVRLSEG